MSEHVGWLSSKGEGGGRKGKGKPRMKDCGIGITDGLPSRSMNHGLGAKLGFHLASYRYIPSIYRREYLTILDVRGIFEILDFEKIEDSSSNP